MVVHARFAAVRCTATRDTGALHYAKVAPLPYKAVMNRAELRSVTFQVSRTPACSQTLGLHPIIQLLRFHSEILSHIAARHQCYLQKPGVSRAAQATRTCDESHSPTASMAWSHLAVNPTNLTCLFFGAFTSLFM